MITNFKRLNLGATFFLPQFPGSTYRKAGAGAAEIVVSRHDSAYNGHLLTLFGTDRPVATSPSDPLDAIQCQICGLPVGEPYDECLCNACRRLMAPAKAACLVCGCPVPEEGLCCDRCADDIEALEGEALL